MPPKSYLKFSEENKKFIIEKFLEGNSPKQVKRAFGLQFGFSRDLANKHIMCFKNVFNTYKKGGEKSIGIAKPKAPPKSKVNQQTLTEVKAHFEANPKSSVREAGRELNIGKSTVHEYVTKHLGMYAYKVRMIIIFYAIDC